MKSTISLVFARAWMNICAIGTFIAVSRFLGPAEFGMFALASSLSLLPHWLVGAGACEYVLGRDVAGRNEDTAWTLGVLSGVGAAFAICGFGIGAYYIYDSKEALIIFTGFALATLLWGLAATRESMLIRDGRGSTVAVIGFISDTAAFVALLLALVAGAGVYALIVSRVVLGVVGSTGFLLATKRWLRFSLDRKVATEILQFGSGILGTRVVGWANGYGGDIIVGAFLAMADVGLFRMGLRIFQAAHSVLLQAPGPAILAMAGRAAVLHNSRLIAVLQRTATMQLALTLPLFTGLAASAGMIVDLVLQPQWHESALVLAATCASIPGMLMIGVVAAGLNASGKSHTVFMLIAISAPVALLSMYLGASGGPAAVAALRGVVMLATGAVSIWLIPDITRAGCWRMLSGAVRISVAGIIMFAWCYGLISLIQSWGVLLRVVAAGGILLTGLIVYVVALRLVAPDPFRLLKASGAIAAARVRRKLRARKAAA